MSTQAASYIETSARGAAIAPELKVRAAELEGMFLAQVLEKLHESFCWGEEARDSSMASFDGLSTSALAGGLASAGGFGLGTLLLRSLQNSTSGSSERIGNQIKAR